MTEHYIATAGKFGFTPEYVCPHNDYFKAVEDLYSRYGFGKHSLIKWGSANRDGKGKFFLEIHKCDCDNMNVHNKKEERIDGS